MPEVPANSSTSASSSSRCGGGASEPAARSKGASAAADLVNTVCCCCGSDHAEKRSGVWICHVCFDIDSSASRSLEQVPRARPVAAKACKLALPMLPGEGKASCSGGPGWELIRVPCDGECLFSSMAIGKMCLLKNKHVPTFDSRSSWGSRARVFFLNHIDNLQAKGESVLGVASMATLVRAGTDLDLASYRRQMSKADADDRKTWGGFLEASLMCLGWRCRVAFFVWQGAQPVLWSTVGEDSVNPAHGHRGWITLLWWGTHYDLLRLSPDVLSLLP